MVCRGEFLGIYKKKTSYAFTSLIISANQFAGYRLMLGEQIYTIMSVVRKKLKFQTIFSKFKGLSQELVYCCFNIYFMLNPNM